MAILRMSHLPPYFPWGTVFCMIVTVLLQPSYELLNSSRAPSRRKHLTVWRPKHVSRTQSTQGQDLMNIALQMQGVGLTWRWARTQGSSAYDGNMNRRGGQSSPLELYRNVVDAEVGRQPLLDTSQNLLAVFHVHVGNAHVARHGMVIRTERPDVNVVHLLHARYAQDSLGDVLQSHLARQSLQQDVA